MSRVVVDVDGSDDGRAAISWCARHASWGDEVIVVASLSLIGEAPLLVPPSVIAQLRQDVRDALQRDWIEPLRARGIPYRSRVEDGPPWKNLLQVADEEDAELIVVGHHRRALFPHAVRSERVVHHSERPVIVVPRARPVTNAAPVLRLVTGPAVAAVAQENRGM